MSWHASCNIVGVGRCKNLMRKNSKYNQLKMIIVMTHNS